jgi:hypothetical protein
MTRVEQRLWQEEGHFREDALNGVEGGVVGGIERRAHGSVGAGQGRAQVWVAAAPVGVWRHLIHTDNQFHIRGSPAARVAGRVDFHHHSDAPISRVLHEG